MRTLFTALLLTLLLAVCTSTQSPGENRNPQFEIERMLNRWQRQLQLTSWRIQVSLVPPGSLGIDENGAVTLAEIEYDRTTSSAMIKVEKGPREHIEQCLLHELTHLKLEAWEPPAESTAEELTIDAIADALLGSGNGFR